MEVEVGHASPVSQFDCLRLPRPTASKRAATLSPHLPVRWLLLAPP
jgi:hypothetical protein